jgi:hypothetical protein
MTIRFCDDRGGQGFSWLVADEPATRTSHVLAAEGRTWLVDPVRNEPALERAHGLGVPAGVLQLLDRHNRDCAALAEELGVPHLTAPDEVPEAPFELVSLRDSKRWRERALWWPDTATLVVAEAIGSNRFFRAGAERVGVHPLLRLTPPRDALGRFEPEHLLVGHGEGLHGTDAAAGLHDALAHSRAGLPRLVLQIPALVVDARRRRR